VRFGGEEAGMMAGEDSMARTGRGATRVVKHKKPNLEPQSTQRTQRGLPQPGSILTFNPLCVLCDLCGSEFNAGVGFIDQRSHVTSSPFPSC
jgi:hypothetical protein